MLSVGGVEMRLWECSLFENKNFPNFTNMTKNNPKVLSIIQKYVDKFIN